MGAQCNDGFPQYAIPPELTHISSPEDKETQKLSKINIYKYSVGKYFCTAKYFNSIVKHLSGLTEATEGKRAGSLQIDLVWKVPPPPHPTGVGPRAEVLGARGVDSWHNTSEATLIPRAEG